MPSKRSPFYRCNLFTKDGNTLYQGYGTTEAEAQEEALARVKKVTGKKARLEDFRVETKLAKGPKPRKKKGKKS